MLNLLPANRTGIAEAIEEADIACIELGEDGMAQAD
jgi:hypothetical protein